METVELERSQELRPQDQAEQPLAKRMDDDGDYRKRVQLEFGRETYDRLVAIKRSAGASSFTKVIRQAMVLLDWYFQCRVAGHRLGVMTRDGTFVPAPDINALG